MTVKHCFHTRRGNCHHLRDRTCKYNSTEHTCPAGRDPPVGHLLVVNVAMRPEDTLTNWLRMQVDNRIRRRPV